MWKGTAKQATKHYGWRVKLGTQINKNNNSNNNHHNNHYQDLWGLQGEEWDTRQQEPQAVAVMTVPADWDLNRPIVCSSDWMTDSLIGRSAGADRLHSTVARGCAAESRRCAAQGSPGLSDWQTGSSSCSWCWWTAGWGGRCCCPPSQQLTPGTVKETPHGHYSLCLHRDYTANVIRPKCVT